MPCTRVTAVLITLYLLCVNARPVLQEDDLRRDELLHLLRNGLNKTTDEQTVAVIGCGASGLLLTKMLLDAGYLVDCLEADSYAGGRASTAYFKTFDLLVDMGAMRFPCAHWATLALADMMNLSIRPFQSAGPESLYYLAQTKNDDDNVRPFPRKCVDYHNQTGDYDPFLVQRICASYNITDEREIMFSDQYFDITVEPLIKKLTANLSYWKVLAYELDQYSTRSYLEAQNWSEMAIDMWAVTQNQESYLDISFLEYFRDYAGMWWEDSCKCEYPSNNPLYKGIPQHSLWELSDGASSLTTALFQQHQDNVRFGALVTKIEQGADVKVTWRKHNFETESRRYDFAFITAPLTAVRHIEFDRRLNFAIERAIRQSHYVEVVKIALMYEHRWWEQPNPLVSSKYHHLGLKNGGCIVTDESIRTIYFPTNPKNASSRAFVLVYIWGEEAKRWSSMSNQEKEQLAASLVDKISGGKSDEYFEWAMSMDWSIEPYHGGAFYYERPGDYKRNHQALGRFDGRLRIVGEAVSTDHSWIQGALSSALEALVEFDQLVYEFAQMEDIVSIEINDCEEMKNSESTVPADLSDSNVGYLSDANTIQEHDNETGVNRTIFCMLNSMQMTVDMPPSATASNHSHEQEQWGMVIFGEVSVTVEEDTQILSSGMQYYIPPGTHHVVMNKLQFNNSQVMEFISPCRSPCLSVEPSQPRPPTMAVPLWIIVSFCVLALLVAILLTLILTYLVRQRMRYHAL